MKYSCDNCNKQFDIPAWINYTPRIVTQLPPYANPIPCGYWPQTTAPIQHFVGTNYEYNIPCCPFCYSKNIKELEE